MLAQQRERLEDLPWPRLRGRIVERDHEIALGRRPEPPLDEAPGLQIVGQRDRAEIVAERRAEPGGGGLHGGDAGHDADVETSRQAGSPASSASNTAAAMAKTPGSPPETTATARPSRASASACARAIQFDAIVAGVARLARRAAAARSR